MCIPERQGQAAAGISELQTDSRLCGVTAWHTLACKDPDCGDDQRANCGDDQRANCGGELRWWLLETVAVGYAAEDHAVASWWARRRRHAELHAELWTIGGCDPPLGWGRNFSADDRADPLLYQSYRQPAPGTVCLVGGHKTQNAGSETRFIEKLKLKR